MIYSDFFANNQNFIQQWFTIAGQNTKRDSGRKVQLENINAGKVNEINIMKNR